jgi:hypothetical protein
MGTMKTTQFLPRRRAKVSSPPVSGSCGVAHHPHGVEARGENGVKYEVGKFYDVPCVRTLCAVWGSEPGLWLPIFGGLHEDADIIGFQWQHWHIDWRFASNKFMERASYKWEHRYDKSFFARVVRERDLADGITIKRRKCLRQMPDFPSQVEWMLELEKEYRNHVLSDCLKCPHRGANLSAMVPDENGLVVCPMHGLRWNVKSRTLFPRVMKDG